MTSVEVLGLGVRIDLDVPLPGKPAIRVDLDVSLGPEAWPTEIVEASERLCYTSPDASEHGVPIVRVYQHGDDLYRLRYWDASEFLVNRAGTRVWARWPAELPVSEIVGCLLGPIIGFVLHLRGTPCLHASAVAVNGRVVAFLGHSGAGKSTTVASFVRGGYAAITDDVLALDETQDSGFGIQDSGTHGAGYRPSSFLVRPGHHVVRLRDDAVRALYGAEDALPPGFDAKRHLDISASGDDARNERLPLGAIYVLEDRRADLATPVEITPLRGHAALMALVALTYMNYVLDGALRARALDVFSRLAATVPIRQVIVRDNVEDLGAIRDGILRDFNSLP
jgi:hypothetical protein